MTLGEKIQQLRKETGLSQETLAEQLGVSRQAISKWELGEATPDTDKIVRLCRLFHISTDYLLFDEMEQDEKLYSIDQRRNVETDISVINEKSNEIDKEKKEHDWYKHFLGKWVKIFLDDQSFGGFYQIAIIAIDETFLLFQNTDSSIGIVTVRNIKTITEADIYRRKKNQDDIPKISLKTVPEGYNMLKYFIGRKCKIHLECKSLFRSPGGFYNAVISDVSEDSILVTYKNQKSVIKTDRLLTLMEW